MVSQVAGLANFSPHFLGLFWGFEMRHGLQVWPMFGGRVSGISFKLPMFSGF